MIAGGPWAEYVPEPVADVIREIDGPERIQTVSQLDSAGED
jgi:nicotinamide mononucleotide adenylyltransferase